MIKVKVGLCLDCGKDSPLIAKRCKLCYWRSRSSLNKNKLILDEKPVKNKIYKIPKISDKRKVQNVLYLKKRRIFMEQNKNCQANLSGCNKISVDLHHKAGRCGSLLTDERYFLALCRSCHSFIEEHPVFAKERGFSISRISFF